MKAIGGKVQVDQVNITLWKKRLLNIKRKTKSMIEVKLTSLIVSFDYSFTFSKTYLF